MQVNIDEAQSNLDRLIQRALAGEVIILAQAGKPVARLSAIPPSEGRKLGTAVGMIAWEQGWEKPLSESEMNDFS